MRSLGLALLLAAIGAAGCTEKSPTGPSSGNLKISSVSPTGGSTDGGTAIVITGSGFAAGATVTVGGTAAANVVVSSATEIRAVTPAHAAGAAAIIVSVAGEAATLAGGFTYSAPAAPNAPPVITALSGRGSKPNEPSGFVDLGETITLTATVTDAETPVSQLTYEWTAPQGTITGTGASVSFLATQGIPAPSDLPVTLTVIERYQGTDPNGAPAQKENRVTGTLTLHVHDSVREVGDLALDFLFLFSTSSVSPENVVHNFSTTCDGGRGRADELADVTANRAKFIINSAQISRTSLTVNFGGVCTLKNPHNADACVTYHAKWVSTVIATGQQETVDGTELVTGVYENNKWFLCHSEFKGS